MTSHTREPARVTGPIIAAAIVAGVTELAAVALLLGVAEEINAQAEETARRPTRQPERQDARLLRAQGL